MSHEIGQLISFYLKSKESYQKISGTSTDSYEVLKKIFRLTIEIEKIPAVSLLVIRLIQK